MTQFRKTFIALGANLGDKADTFRRAIQQINTRIGEVKKVSPFIATAPLNPPGLESQPEFLNGALLCESALDPQKILSTLLVIEAELGRVRTPENRWGPRVIDLDLIAVEDLVLKTKDLTLPHPEMHKRDFVLIPLSKIAPDFIHPIIGKSITELLAAL